MLWKRLFVKIIKKLIILSIFQEELLKKKFIDSLGLLFNTGGTSFRSSVMECISNLSENEFARRQISAGGTFDTVF